MSHVYQLRCPKCGGLAATTLAAAVRGIPVCGSCIGRGERVVLVEAGKRESRLACETCKSDAPSNIRTPRDSVAHYIAGTDLAGVPTGTLKRCGYWVTVAVLLAFALPARAESSFLRSYRENWKAPGPVAITAHILAEGLVVADTLQSMDIKNHSGMFESNFLLPKHPSDATFACAGLLSVAVTTAAWYAAPPSIRWLVDAGIFYVEAPIVYSNAKRWGLVIRVPFQ